MYKFFSTFVFIFCISTSFVFADDIVITQYPTNPKLGEQVTLTLTSDKYNLNIANIVWTVDGVEADSGVGRKTLNLNTNIEGKTQVVDVKVSQDGFNDGETQLFFRGKYKFSTL